MDRSRRPETEAWFFLSGQIPGRCSSTNETQCPDCTAALLAIIKHVSTLPIPESVHTDDAAASEYTKHLSDTSILMIGSLAQLPVDILNSHNLVRTDLPGINIPYQKFIIRTAGLSKLKTSLPEGLRWAEVRQQDYALVKSRTSIPKKDKTLALLPSVAVFPTDGDTPIAWAFVGPDGSLATLHTEPEYRGQGLAKAVTTKLFNERLKLFDEEEGKEEGGWLAHSNVAMDNVQSSAVARSLGGTPGWVVYWLRVDLRKFSDA
jgi:hypothetical protein